MTNQNDKLERWLNAYLDGALAPADAARFESVIDRNPQLRERIERQHDIEASLRRSFMPPTQAPEIPDERSVETIPMTNRREGDVDGAATRKKSGGLLKGLAIAAMLAIVAGGGWWGWQNRAMFMGGRLTMAQFYEKAAEQEFKEDWVCKNDQQFQTTFWYRLGHGVALAQAPTGVDVHGIKYGETLSPLSVHLTADVDGKGVIVFVDKKENAPKDDVTKKGLHTYSKQSKHLVFVEVSPLERPVLLNLLTETEVPQKWKDEMDVPMMPKG